MLGSCQRNVMSHERLAALIAAHQDTLATHPEASATQESILTGSLPSQMSTHQEWE
jgi:hypothetical protein